MEELGHCATNTMLTPDEHLRYQYHLSLPNFGLAAQTKLKDARILIIGMGALGCAACQYLAAVGTGHLTIMDGDSVEASNLQRQILYAEQDIGRPKATTAAHRLQQLNSLITIQPIEAFLTPANALKLIHQADIVVDGTDNFPARYLINDACVITHKPLVFASICQYEGQVCVFNHQQGPTYRCLFPAPPNQAPNCSVIGTLGVLPGIIGTLQATEAIKLATGIGKPLSGILLIWNALTARSRCITVPPHDSNRSIANLNKDPSHYDHPTKPCRHKQLTATVSSAAQALQAILASNTDYQLIDVCEAYEITDNPLSATHWPFSAISQHPNTLPRNLNPALPTFLYCYSGQRSHQAVDILKRQNSFPHIYALDRATLGIALNHGSVNSCSPP